MKNYIIFLVLLCMVLLGSCREDDSTFENKLFIDSASKTAELFLKYGVTEIEKNIQSSLPKPALHDVNIVYKADVSLVDKYNSAYYDKAIALPDSNYVFENNTAIIEKGSVHSTGATIRFIKLDELDHELVYVLPVTVDNANIELLQSARTHYYVFKGAALINVVADIEENYLTINWEKPEVCNDLSQLTMEALIRVRNYDRMISTVMGIEGTFLIRLGDAGFPANQIQIATQRGNFPDGDSNKGLPTGEWVHIALTYDSADGSMIVYVNGKKQSEGIKNVGLVSLGIGGTNGFCIGRSYADERFLAGEIAECRIWNVVRTQEEIAANPYYVEPKSEGLVAYWKFDDESALSIQDYTENGNHAVANSTLRWTPVSLPAKEE